MTQYGVYTCLCLQYPEGLVQVLKSCLEVDPTKRPCLAVVRADLLRLQQCDAPVDLTEQQQVVVASVSIPSPPETSVEALPQPELVSVEQTIAAEIHESDCESAIQASATGDGIGLLTFPIAETEPGTQSTNHNTRTTHNDTSNEGHSFNGVVATGQEAPPSYAEVCGDAEARSLDTPSSSDDDLTGQIDVPPPLPATRRPRPPPLARQRWRHALSAVMLRDLPGFDETGGQQEVQRQRETAPLGYSDDESTPIPLLAEVEVPEFVHADYAAVDLEERFCAITSATRSVARYYLTLCGGVLENAISVYMEACRRSPQPPMR